MDENSSAYTYHKLRSPLAVIKSAISLVTEGRTGPISEETKKFLNQAYTKTEELIHFIDNMEATGQQIPRIKSEVPNNNPKA